MRPERKPRMYQRWEELLFLHWSCEPNWIAHLIPEGLTLDLHDGKAWVAVVPFRMRGVRFRGLPALPGISNFNEINVRTYVHDAQGRPGVWFLSLDTDSRLAAWLGRGLFGLNYHTAEIQFERTGTKVLWHAARRGEEYREKMGYRIREELPEAAPGSLEFFLLERYHYFAMKGGRLQIGQIHHKPYPLAVSDVGHWYQAPLVWNGIKQFAKPPDHMICSPGVDVEIFRSEPVRG